MSQDIIQEVTFFLHSIVMGVVITFVYDWFLIFRKLLKHNILWISFEDFLFWAGCGVGVFYMLYRENNGVLRWFTVLGAMLGMILYKALVSKWFVHIMSTLIYKIMWFLFRVIQIVVKPLKFLLSIIKLTYFLKTLKMVLCKH